LKQIARDGVVLFEEMHGRPQLALADLPALPDEAIAQLVPSIRVGVEIFLSDGVVHARLPDRDTPVVVFHPTSVATLIFNGFNGERSLGELARELSVATSWPAEQSLAAVKDLFLDLVRLGVCVPGNYVR